MAYPPPAPDEPQHIERDFSAQRAADREAGRPLTSPEALSRQLQVAKLLSKSYGLTSLLPAVWAGARDLEQARTARVEALPKRKEGAVSSVNGIAATATLPKAAAPIVGGAEAPVR